MKLFELYNKRPLREDKTLRASIKLCESIVRVLESSIRRPILGKDLTDNQKKQLLTIKSGQSASLAYWAWHVLSRNSINNAEATKLERIMNEGTAPSKKWKQTSLTPAAAKAKHGSKNVRVTKAGQRDGKDMVEVFVESINKHISLAEGNGYAPGLADTAQAIVDKYNSDPRFRARVDQSSEFYNALVDFSGIIDLDHPKSDYIIDILDRWGVSGVEPKDQTGQEDSSHVLSQMGLEEDEGDFEYTPDPAFAGVKGVSRDSGTGNQAAAQAQQKQQNAKLNATWVSLVKALKTMDPARAKVLRQSMQKVAKSASQRNFTLSPNPEQVLGL